MRCRRCPQGRARGRIAEERDDHGRSVHYTYDSDGLLTTVRDIAGSDWGYSYRDGGRLGAASDPEGRTYLATTYGDDGRVAQAFGGRLYSYGYAEASTTVTEEGGLVAEASEMMAGIWGVAYFTYSVDALTCQEVCADAVYRIVGRIVPVLNEGYFRSDVWPVGSCSAGTRSSANKTRTEAHERNHLAKRASVINARQHARRDYSSMEACERGLGVFKNVLAREYGAEDARQSCHLDEFYRGEFVHEARCLTPSPQSVEVATTRPHYGICSNL